MCGFSSLDEFKTILRSIRGLIKVRLWCNMSIKNLNLLLKSGLYSIQLLTAFSAYEVMSIFHVAADSHFSRGITEALLLYGPLTPIKSINRPRCEIITICWHGIDAIIGIRIRAHRTIW